MDLNDVLAKLNMSLDDLVDEIHGEHCGCDDKFCDYPQEIQDWLEEGSYDGTETVDSLTAEWIELCDAAEQLD